MPPAAVGERAGLARIQLRARGQSVRSSPQRIPSQIRWRFQRCDGGADRQPAGQRPRPQGKGRGGANQTLAWRAPVEGSDVRRQRQADFRPSRRQNAAKQECGRIKERRNPSADAHGEPMGGGKPLFIVVPWAWAIRYRPSLFLRASLTQGAAESVRRCPW
jgi:hypothetical protein